MNGTVYRGESTEAYPGRRSTSLKYATYILVNCTDDLLRQYALFDSLFQRRHDPSFRRNLQVGLQQLSKTIFERVDASCRAKEMVITDVALTIPGHWSLEFEDLYAEISGCVFQAVSGENGVSFFWVGDPFGASGGSDHWEEKLARLCSARIENKTGVEMTCRHRQVMQDGFISHKDTVGPEICDNNVVIALRERVNDLWNITITKRVVNKSLEDDHRKILGVAAEKVSQFAGREGVFVIYSGGTGRHPTLQKRLNQVCEEAELPKPLYADGFDSAYDTAVVAKDAAYAVGQRITAEMFFEYGGSIGLHHKQGTNNSRGLWDNEATSLVGMNHHQDVKINIISSADELQIICEPYQSAAEEMRNLHHRRCYNFLALGSLPAGQYTFSCKTQGSGDNFRLELKPFRKPVLSRMGRRPPPGSDSVWQLEATSPIPVFFDPGANCVFVGKHGQAVSEINIPKVPRITLATTMNATGGLRLEGLRSGPRTTAPSRSSQRASVVTGPSGAARGSINRSESSGPEPIRRHQSKPARSAKRFDPLARPGRRGGRSGSGSGSRSGRAVA